MHPRLRGGLALLLWLACAATSLAQPAVWPPIADPPTTLRNTGRFVWADLVTNDVGMAAAFYGRVFGWTFETFGPADDDLRSYTRVLANGRPIGGMVFGADALNNTTGGRWVGHVSTRSVGGVVATAISAGGRVLKRPQLLGERGVVALLRDPYGGVFAAIDSASGDPDDFLGEVGEWLWIELWTDRPQHALEFYAEVFGYEVYPDAKGQSHTLVKEGVARARVVRKPDRLPGTTTWIPCVRVADVDAAVRRAREAGGRVVIDPTRYRGSRAALLVDPVGAPFAVAEWQR